MTQRTSRTRRKLVKVGLQLPIVGAAGGLLSACGGADAPVCANPDEWSISEAGLRKANAYTESSPHADKNCSNCAFYTPESETCGQCEIFTSIAHRDGYCNSWSEVS